MRDLEQAFGAAWSGTAPPGELGAALAELCGRARTAYPALVFDDAELVAAVARRAPADDEDLIAYLDRCRAGELALALAAGRGDVAAIATIEQVHHGAVDAMCRRFATATHSVDDLHQALRERLFVGAHPRILDYAGHGLLDNWLRVTAVRLFLDLQKRKDRAREQPESDSGIAAAPDPSDLGLEIIKVEYRQAVRAAIEHAARGLAPGDRHVLREHLVGGLTIDQLAVALGIHRATAARRIARARQQLITATRDELAARLAVAPHELDEMFGLVASRLDLSMSKLLASLS